MTLQELIEKLEGYVDGLLADDADLTNEQLEVLAQLSKEKTDKVDGYGYVHERLSAELEGAKAQLLYVTSRYEKRVRQLEVAKLRLEQRLVGLHKDGQLKVTEKGGSYKLNFRNYPTVRVNVNPEDLPEEFKTVETKVKPNKNALKNAIKDDPDSIAFMAELEDNYKAHFKLN